MSRKPMSGAAKWMVLGCAVAAIAVLEPRVVLSKTESVKYRVLFLADGEPHKGDYINIIVRHPLLDANQDVTLTKRIGCTAGETLIFRDGEHFCGAESLGHVLARTSKGKPLTPFVWQGPIPPGKIFVVGDHVRSLDSRYFGFVDLAQARKVWPLF